MKPVMTGIGARRLRRSGGEARADGAVGHRKIHRGVRELIVGPHEVARVGQFGRVKAIQVGGQNERGQPLAEAGGHVERARRAVAQQVDALQRAPQLVEQRVHLFPGPGPPARDERRDRRAMPPGDLVERAQIRRVAAFGETRAIEQLVRDAAKRRHHHEHRLAPACLENDRANGANGRRRGERRPAELENLHGKSCSVPRRAAVRQNRRDVTGSVRRSQDGGHDAGARLAGGDLLARRQLAT